MSIDLADPKSDAQQKEPEVTVVHGKLDLFKFKVPTDLLRTGSVVSMMDPERVFIHSYTNGEATQTFAFVNGLPIPLNLFVLCLCVRMAPKRVNGQVPTRVRPSGALMLTCDEENTLWDFYAKLDLAADLRILRDGYKVGHATEWSIANYARNQVNLLLAHCMKGDDETSREAYCEMIRRIDEDYAASLIDPIRI